MTLLLPRRRPFLPVEAGNLWPAVAWPNVYNVGEKKGYGNAGGGWAYVDGMPTLWSIYDNGTNAQWDWSFGVYGGERYFNWRWWDDFNWGNTFNEFTLDGGGTAYLPVAPGQVYNVGFYAAFDLGTNTYPSNLGVVWDELDSGGSYANTVDNLVMTSPATQISKDPYRPTRVAGNMTVTAGSAARILPGIYIDWGSKTSADQCILRIYKPFIRRVS